MERQPNRVVGLATFNAALISAVLPATPSLPGFILRSAGFRPFRAVVRRWATFAANAIECRFNQRRRQLVEGRHEVDRIACGSVEAVYEQLLRRQPLSETGPLAA